jgi:hypothetical protein
MMRSLNSINLSALVARNSSELMENRCANGWTRCVPAHNPELCVMVFAAKNSDCLIDSGQAEAIGEVSDL